jgi:hypothetical protein
MNKTMSQVLFTAVLIATLLAACAPAPAPTVSPIEIANQVGTSVALTVASQNLDTAQAQPPATETPLPTVTLAPDTPTPLPPLDTPTAVQLPTKTASSSGGGGGTTSSNDYSCDAINRKPYDYAVYKPGDRFDIKWTIVNNGKKALRAGLDLKYSNGDKLMADKVVELPALDPGDEYQVDFDAVAPEKAGNYVMVYIVEGGLCFPYTAITVEK